MTGFADQIAEFNQRVQDATLWAFKEAFVELGDRVIDRTPVRSGQAQGSWRSSLNGPDHTPALKRKAEDAKAELRAAAERLTLGDTANIASTLDYIVELEYGKSDQAPEGHGAAHRAAMGDDPRREGCGGQVEIRA